MPGPDLAGVRLVRRRRREAPQPALSIGHGEVEGDAAGPPRAAASIRRLSNEPELLTAIGGAAGDAGAHVRLLSDAPPLPLADTMRLLSRAVALVGVHGAGWANLLFAGAGAHALGGRARVLLGLSLPRVRRLHTQCRRHRC